MAQTVKYLVCVDKSEASRVALYFACKKAAKSCEQIGDEKMMACAKVIHACADTCKEFAELSEAA